MQLFPRVAFGIPSFGSATPPSTPLSVSPGDFIAFESRVQITLTSASGAIALLRTTHFYTPALLLCTRVGYDLLIKLVKLAFPSRQQEVAETRGAHFITDTSKMFSAIALFVLVSTSVAQEVGLTQRTTWSPEVYTEEVLGGRYRDFTPVWNPQLANEYETQVEEDLEPIDDRCTLYKAKLTQTELYFQYIRYKVDIPDMHEFTLCMWMRSDNLSNDHTIFSYAVDGQPHEIRSWLSNSNRSSYFNLAVGGTTTGKPGEQSVHLFSINYPFRRRRWYHTCQSWSGITGNWLVYVEGERIGAGNSPATKGRVIRGGGVPVTGQTQHQTGGGFVERGGIEGEVTLFYLYPSAFPQPLHVADTEGRRFYESSCDGLCKDEAQYPFARSATEPKIIPTQTTSSLIFSPTSPMQIPLHPSTVSYYSVTEPNDFYDIVTPFPSFHPAAISLPRQIVFQETPVPNGGVQVFSTEGIRVARSASVYTSTENVADFTYGQFEPRRINAEGRVHHSLGYQQQGLFQPVGAPGIYQYGGSSLFRYGNNLEKDTTTASTRELRPGEVADVTLPYDDGAGLTEYGIQRDLTPVIDWRTSKKKLYAGAMWLRANPVCRKF
ncbi:hypothetical protein J437_LFUL001854 [Ladona fulva]|uniref:Pentraxin (PTX) domain-containing protein n=1 Tax=Ladona fulva TaxID=123851 RepID=A0A8K0JUX6_LADFU|nr:hypothetical protein J437_LFUL001854 [Ladona fulva]